MTALRIGQRPFDYKQPEFDTFTAPATFTCPRPGTARLTYRATFDMTLLRDLDGAESRVRETVSESAQVRCGMPEPVVRRLEAKLAAPITTYSVDAFDPDGGALTYTWAMVADPPDTCGTLKAPWKQEGAGDTVRWSHSDRPPDNCTHLGTDHKVSVYVTVRTGSGQAVQCALEGSENQSVDKPSCKPAP